MIFVTTIDYIISYISFESIELGFERITSWEALPLNAFCYGTAGPKPPFSKKSTIF